MKPNREPDNRKGLYVMAKEHLGLLFAGLAVGDSLGSTSEFTSREEVLKLYEKHREKGWPFRHVGEGYFKWRPGQPTDDSEMAACMVRSYLERGSFDPGDVAGRLVEWVRSGPRDVGTTTTLGIGCLTEGAPWCEGGLKDFTRRPMNASNGSLMRNGIVPGLADDLDEALKISLFQGIMTHYGPLPVLCCGVQTYLVWEFLEGRNPLEKNWLKMFRGVWTDWLDESGGDKIVSAWRKNVEVQLPKAWTALSDADFDPLTFSPFVYSPIGGAGYVLTALQYAVWATHWGLRSEPFPAPPDYPAEVFEKGGPWVLAWLAMTGGDTDTYCAIAGPIIAAALGSLPGEMLEGLEIMREFGTLIVKAER